MRPMILALNARRQLVTAQSAARQGTYYCPGCHAPVVLKRGQVVLAHFAHQPHASCTTFSEGETAEHLTGKRQLADWFERSGFKVQLEARLPALHQRPDILVTRADQAPLAIEFQCSPLSTQRLQERTAGYRQNGYRVLWLLGRPYFHGVRTHGKALKFMQHSRFWGCYVSLWDVAQRRLMLKYDLLTIDGEPLLSRSWTWGAKRTTVDQVDQFRPPLPMASKPARRFQPEQRAWLLERLRHRGRARELQTVCYQNGGTLQQLPAWTVTMRAKPPLLKGPYLSWYLHVFLALKTRRQLTVAQLDQLLWDHLRPRLARNACLRHRGRLIRKLIDELIQELAEAGVLSYIQDHWQVDAERVRWEKG